MQNGSINRRQALAGAAASWAFAHTAYAQTNPQTPTPTNIISTSAGRVRGVRSNGVSSFLGIPYGGDTGPRRFQPATAAPGWRGVRACDAYGNSAPQPAARRTASNAAANNFLAQLFAGVPGETPPPDSETCLYLNVYTPDASRARKRPVLFWLHGGGFAQGNGSTLMYEGGNLCRRGDVVVVTSNHRLNAMGYLYLGALHDDFADSGMVGQLDQQLALQWVRDNIENFGGDPDNITIFGESGGGAKVSALLAMPSARGLFHKAIIQSGPGLRMVDRDAAASHAERTLAALNVPTSDVNRLRTMDFREIIAAATDASSGATGRSLAPVVDGRSLPRHPFDPDAPATASGIPVIVGTCKDEATLFSVSDPQFGTMTEAQARERFTQALGDRADAGLEVFRRRAPNDAPTYWYTSMATARGTWMDSIRLAERKHAQAAGNVFMYRLDWETPVMDGGLKAPHGLDTPLVFDNAHSAPGLVGPGPNPGLVAAAMSQSWINFARSGDPSIPDVTWPAYDPARRLTMIFEPQSHVVSDPDSEVRRFFSA